MGPTEEPRVRRPLSQRVGVVPVSADCIPAARLVVHLVELKVVVVMILVVVAWELEPTDGQRALRQVHPNRIGGVPMADGPTSGRWPPEHPSMLLLRRHAVVGTDRDGCLCLTRVVCPSLPELVMQILVLSARLRLVLVAGARGEVHSAFNVGESYLVVSSTG